TSFSRDWSSDVCSSDLLALAEETVADDLGLEANPASLNELEKYDLIPALVAALQSEIGYPATVEELKGEAQFKLGHFFIRLLVTDRKSVVEGERVELAG